MKKVKELVVALPDKKRYAELITAVLSVPVLITVLLLNLNTLRPKTTSPAVEPTPTAQHTPSPTQSANTAKTTITATPQPQICTKEVGPVEILSPTEGQEVTSDPVCIDIARKGTNYCEVAVSYRINNSAWSDYMDKSICLYNMSPGTKNLEVRVKSIASSDQTVLKRTFIIPQDPTPTPIATSSATTQ